MRDEQPTPILLLEHVSFEDDPAKVLTRLQLTIGPALFRAGNGSHGRARRRPPVAGRRGEAKNGIVCNPNIPTEEVFTTPHARRVDGHVVSTKLLSYQGTLIDACGPV